MNAPAARSILVIRRDNIGDLLCTTPLISSLRKHYPQAWIGVLTNSYAAPALANNSDIDEVLVYEKGKHLDSTTHKLRAFAQRCGMIWRLRQRGIDLAILPASGNQRSAERFARLSGAARTIRADDVNAASGPHEVESAFRCATALGIQGPPPAMTLRPSRQAPAAMHTSPDSGPGPLIGLHISARKPLQRWPVERFAQLARQLHQTRAARFRLFWAPGSADDAKHPGDDEKAARLGTLLQDVPFEAVPTSHLTELIDGLAACDMVICSDGGAMHVAAALGKPIVCFFGNSEAARWHPWGVPHVLLQPESCDVSDISVETAVEACAQLRDQCASSQFAPTPTSASSGTLSEAT